MLIYADVLALDILTTKKCTKINLTNSLEHRTSRLISDWFLVYCRLFWIVTQLLWIRSGSYIPRPMVKCSRCELELRFLHNIYCI